MGNRLERNTVFTFCTRDTIINASKVFIGRFFPLEIGVIQIKRGTSMRNRFRPVTHVAGNARWKSVKQTGEKCMLDRRGSEIKLGGCTAMNAYWVRLVEHGLTEG